MVRHGLSCRPAIASAERFDNVAVFQEALPCRSTDDLDPVVEFSQLAGEQAVPRSLRDGPVQDEIELLACRGVGRRIGTSPDPRRRDG